MKRTITLITLILMLGISLMLGTTAASGAIYSLSDASGNAGETVRLTLSYESGEAANSIGLAKMDYDESALMFIGFEDTEAMEDISILPPTFDDEKAAIALALQGEKTSIDPICTLVFKIKDTAAPGKYEVGFNTLVTKLGSEEIASSMNKGEIEVKGSSAVSRYTVSYDANGGTGAPAAQTKSHGVGIKLSTTKPTRAGYSFAGWGVSPDSESSLYAAGDLYTKNADVTLYAVWVKITPALSVGDTNADGKITALDAVILVRHLAGWKGYESLPYAG